MKTNADGPAGMPALPGTALPDGPERMPALPVMPLNVLLGGLGDICAMLPFLEMEARRCGGAVPVLVSKECAPIFDGTSYVKPVIWPGTFHQLFAALQFLKSDLPELPIRLLQFYGSGQPKGLPSFLHEMHYMSGRMPRWEERTPFFDMRDRKREQKLVDRIADGRPMVLVAPRGRSSPFNSAEDMLRAVRAVCGPRCKVVDLSKVRAHRIYDLIGLYDRAAALVSIDTVHLHLCHASKVPVLALARDYPTLWHGVPWQRRFAFHCRYGQWAQRRAEFAQALRDVMEHVERPEPELMCGGLPGRYNPSLLKNGADETLCAVRYHPDPQRWETRLEIVTLGHGDVERNEVRFPRKLSGWSQEDMRLFRLNGKLMGSYTLAKQLKNKQARCAIGYSELELDPVAQCWRLKKHVQPKYGRNNGHGMEKNWVFFEHVENEVNEEGRKAGRKTGRGKLMAIYKCHREQVVLELKGERVLREFVSRAPTWGYGEIRGGTGPMEIGGRRAEGGGRRSGDGPLWLRFFHSWMPIADGGNDKSDVVPMGRTRVARGLTVRYYMGALLMDATPPFRIRRISRRPILAGNEWNPGKIPHLKLNVVIPYGALEDDEGEWLVSVGVNDAAAATVRLRWPDLFLD